MPSLINGCFCGNRHKSVKPLVEDSTCTDVQEPLLSLYVEVRRAPRQQGSRKAKRIERWRLFKIAVSELFLRNVNLDRQYFKALKTEGLLVALVSSVRNPVLNIAWLFTDGELRNTRQSFHRSFQKYTWDTVICEGITAEMKAKFNYDKINEPILDGIPCSYWLAAIEPTIPMILELFSRRHKKSNLSKLRVIEDAFEEMITRHGDTFFEHLDPDMFGPHQLLVNRALTTPFPTMELGATAALVHNAIVSREHYFQEPFRSRRPNHRSRCTRRPRPSQLSRHGKEPALVPDPSNISNDDTDATVSTLVAGSEYMYRQMLVDFDPHWYVPFILQLAAFSQTQTPEVDGSSDEDIATIVEEARRPGQIPSASDENSINIPRSSSIESVCSPEQPSENRDSDIPGCSWMDTLSRCHDDDMVVNDCKTESRTSYRIPSSKSSSIKLDDKCPMWKCNPLKVGCDYTNHKSEIDEVFCVGEDSGEMLEALHEFVEDGNIDEYVDFILSNAVLSLRHIQKDMIDQCKLSPWYLDTVDGIEPIERVRSLSSPGCDFDTACTSAEDLGKQLTPYVPCPNCYHDECVVDEMANFNQSAHQCAHSGCRCKYLNNRNGGMPDMQDASLKEEIGVPEADFLNQDLVMMNVNQSALYMHTHHRYASRCSYSPDTWVYDPYEYNFHPTRRRPVEKTIRSWKASIKKYIGRMPEGDMSKRLEQMPSFLTHFGGGNGPVARRFFVRCATECLQDIDEKEPWKWKPTADHEWPFKNRRPEVSPSGSESSDKKSTSVFDKSPWKNEIIARYEKKYSTKEKHVEKKRKIKRRNAFNISNSKEESDVSSPTDDSVEEVKDVLTRRQTSRKEADVKSYEMQQCSVPSPVIRKTLEETSFVYRNRSRGCDENKLPEIQKTQKPAEKSDTFNEVSDDQQHVEKPASTFYSTAGAGQSNVKNKTPYSNQKQQSYCVNKVVCKDNISDLKDIANCVVDDSNTIVTISSRDTLSSERGIQQPKYGLNTKYVSSENDADLSSNDNEEPRRKSKVRYKKRRRSTSQRKETNDVAESDIDDSGGCGNLCGESKNVLAKSQDHATLSNVSYHELSSSLKYSCETASASNETNTLSYLSEKQLNCGSVKKQPNDTTIWTYGDTDKKQSESGEIEDVNSYIDCTDFCQSYSSTNDQRESDFEDDVNEEEKNGLNENNDTEGESSESNDFHRTEEEDRNYDASSSDGCLLGDEGYVMVNVSDMFSSEIRATQRSGSFTNHLVVCSGHSSVTLESGSSCSLGDGGSNTTKSPPLCYKDAGYCKKSYLSLHTHNGTSPVDHVHLGNLDSNKIVKSNGETCIGPNTDCCQDSVQSSSKTCNYRTSEQVLRHTQNESLGDAYVTTLETMVSKDSTEAQCESSAQIRKNKEDDTNIDERPVRLREKPSRRPDDVGDTTNSVDEVRRLRQSRRQRGILHYQWHGLYVLSHMYDNPLGQRIRQYRGRFRAWLDRRRHPHLRRDIYTNLINIH